MQENLTKVKADLEESNGKTGTIESEIKSQKEQNTKLKLAQEKAIKLKDTEITKLESKIKVLEQTTGIRNKQVTDTIKKEFEDQIASKLRRVWMLHSLLHTDNTTQTRMTSEKSSQQHIQCTLPL